MFYKVVAKRTFPCPELLAVSQKNGSSSPLAVPLEYDRFDL